MNMEKCKPIEVFDESGEFSVEFKDHVDKYIKEELEKVTTDGKLDYNKALQYIKEASEKTGVPVSQVLRQVRKEKRLKKYAKD